MNNQYAVVAVITLALGLAGCSGQASSPSEPAATVPAVTAPAAVAQPTAPTTAAAPAAAPEQKTCPVMQGNPIDKDVYVDHGGRRIYFCCADCPNAFRRDPAKYLAILDSASPAPAPAPGGHRH